MGLMLWLIIIALGLVLEAVAILNGDTKEWPTLTRVVKTHVPRWALAMAIGWLAYHFIVEQAVNYLSGQ